MEYFLASAMLGLLINFTCGILIYLFYFSLQKSNRAAAATPGSHPTASGRGRVSATETGCTSSACPPSSWWGRRTSPVKRTTSGRPRSPAASVSLRASPAHPCQHINMDAGTARRIINGPIIPTLGRAF